MSDHLKYYEKGNFLEVHNSIRTGWKLVIFSIICFLPVILIAYFSVAKEIKTPEYLIWVSVYYFIFISFIWLWGFLSTEIIILNYENLIIKYRFLGVNFTRKFDLFAVTNLKVSKKR